MRKNKCDCKVAISGTIFYCPLHKSAPDLYEALEKIRYIANHTIIYDIANQALTKAEGSK